MVTYSHFLVVPVVPCLDAKTIMRNRMDYLEQLARKGDLIAFEEWKHLAAIAARPQTAAEYVSSLSDDDKLKWYQELARGPRCND